MTNYIDKRSLNNTDLGEEQQPLQSINENLWWVIPDKLAGVRKPVAEEIDELQKAGIGAVVSVMDDPSNLELYKSLEIPYLWLPTKGGTAPSSEQIQELQNFVFTQNQLGHAVAVHCTSGRRRTGTMLAAYLIAAGSSYEQAMQTIQDANPDAELRAAQTMFLQELAAKVSQAKDIQRDVEKGSSGYET
jgi:protein-tyrosine phosphatase